MAALTDAAELGLLRAFLSLAADMPSEVSPVAILKAEQEAAALERRIAEREAERDDEIRRADAERGAGRFTAKDLQELPSMTVLAGPLGIVWQKAPDGRWFRPASLSEVDPAVIVRSGLSVLRRGDGT